jgi:hypothetical protein
MAQQAVRAGVRAVKSSRKFVPRKAAVVLVSREISFKILDHCLLFVVLFLQTQTAANQVVRILKESTDAVSIIIYILLGTGVLES